MTNQIANRKPPPRPPPRPPPKPAAKPAAKPVAKPVAKPAAVVAATAVATAPTPAVSAAQTQALLTKQLAANSDITNILNTAIDTLLTSPEYQRQQRTSELQQNLQSAQLNSQTAPLQLENAKKYYYVYTQGRQYYNTMIENELQSKATQITQQLTDKFNEEVQNAKTMNSYFSASQINAENTIELYEEYVKKNAEMQEIIKASHGDILTNDRKTYYETEAISSVQSVQTVMTYVYWLLVVTFIISIFISKSSLLMKQQIVLAVLFILYPFVIDKIVIAVYNYYNNTFIKNTDTNVYLSL